MGKVAMTNSVVAQQLRERLFTARRAAKMRQVDLANRLGRPQSFVSNYERGTRRLEVSEFIQLCKVLRLDAAGVVHDLARP